MADVEDILNWRRWSDQITLSGQPDRDQFRALAASGVTHVLNLALPDQASALAGEAEIVAEAGMRYSNIPVDFEAPTEQDFARFCAVVGQSADETLHVHCIFNARVTAFFYRYAKEGRGGDVVEARRLMDSVWRPGGVWARFIGDEAVVDLPYRFVGRDY